jgi:pyrroline-5-carboxylate reductase
MRIGFAGAGNMAAAMARGWAGAEQRPEAMLFTDLDADRAAALASDVDGETRPGLAELGSDSEAVVVAVKPNALDDVARELAGSAAAVVSVVAATPTARLAEAFPETPVIRLMPNQPVEVRQGVLCYVAPLDMPDEVSERLLSFLGQLGVLVEVEERLMEAAMAVMSCSPAYLAMLAEALAAAGEAEGLEPELSSELVADTLAGTAALLKVREAEAIRDAVAPPGGATEAGLEALERRAVREAVHEAVNASLERFR